MNPLRKLLSLLVLTLVVPHAAAQAVSNQSGKIDEAEVRSGYVIIDGKRMVVREDDVVITYRGAPVEPIHVRAGYSVFYSTRTDGSIRELTLIGPVPELDEINRH